MNLFAFVGVAVGVFAWTSVMSIMTGLQNEIRQKNLQEKPHLLWEGSVNDLLPEKLAQVRSSWGPELTKLDTILQTEGLLEVLDTSERGRILGAGVVIQGLDRGGESDLDMGVELLSTLKLRTGSRVRLHNVWRPEAAPLDLPVNSMFESGVYEIDRGTVRLGRANLARWLDLSPTAFTRLEVQLVDAFKAPELRDRLSHDLGLPLKTWQENDAALWYSLKLEKIVMSLATFFVVVISGFAVHLAMSVRVADKAREIGVLRGLGFADGWILRLYFVEGCVLSFCGAVLGLLAGYGFCYLVSHFGQMPEFFYSSQIPAEWNWSVNSLMALTAVFLAAMASYWPAKKASLVEIQEALRS
jgi:lipoprotein-releasing system permease protein